MEKKVIVAVDGSPASNHALDYVGLLAKDMVVDLKATLLYVMNRVPPILADEGKRDPDAFRRLQQVQTKYRQAAREVLDKAAERLVRQGMPAENIETKSLPRKADAARDILFQAEQGLYDALVVGRKGMSRAQEFFMGSVAKQVVQHAERVPVWVVDGKVTSHKVLCAVDGSDGSLKAVDHMAYMLGGNPRVKVTLFHAAARLANYCPLDFNQEIVAEVAGDIMQSDQRCMDDFYGRAQRVLIEGGLAPEQIETKDRESSLGVVKAIMEEVRDGDYGTVVLGRRGENRSFFLGHVGDKVVSRCQSSAVWLVGCSRARPGRPILHPPVRTQFQAQGPVRAGGDAKPAAVAKRGIIGQSFLRLLPGAKGAALHTGQAPAAGFRIPHGQVLRLCHQIPPALGQQKLQVVAAAGTAAAYREQMVLRAVEGEVHQPALIGLGQPLLCLGQGAAPGKALGQPGVGKVVQGKADLAGTLAMSPQGAAAASGQGKAARVAQMLQHLLGGQNPLLALQRLGHRYHLGGEADAALGLPVVILFPGVV